LFAGDSGEPLADPAKPRKTATFAAQQETIRQRSARGDKAASVLADEILVAIAVLSEKPCIGYRLRGLPALTNLCVYHLPKPFRRWRLIYRYVPGQGALVLILVGEHWRSVARSVSSSGPSTLGSRLRFADVYDAVVSFHGGNSKEERNRIRRAVKVQEKERCCQAR
jgi:hypothetical protein